LGIAKDEIIESPTNSQTLSLHGQCLEVSDLPETVPVHFHGLSALYDPAQMFSLSLMRDHDPDEYACCKLLHYRTGSREWKHGEFGEKVTRRVLQKRQLAQACRKPELLVIGEAWL
jgi:hypothetical protein